MPSVESHLSLGWRFAAPDLVADGHRIYDAIPRFPLLSDEECWRRMPQPIAGDRGPLPNWVRVLAAYAPRTAAAMLELDFAQRTQGPLNAALKAKLRWIVARANRCAYSLVYAAEDLQRAGADDAELRALAAWDHDFDADREAIQFVWQLAGDAPSVTDEQFHSLVSHYGERSVAAMVLLAAYGNFQDRLFLALNLPVELVGPLPPLAVRFDSEAFSPPPSPPLRRRQPLLAAGDGFPLVDDPKWSELDYEVLQGRMEIQRRRKSRVRIPTWEEIQAKLPPEYPTHQPVSIASALVCVGHVPELALPWNAVARMFWAETQQDRIWEESLFWIQTRVLECSYCMGHCEMRLELAGLDRAAIAQRLRRLASGDWSCFSPDDQLAFAFACLLTKSPWEVTDGDIEAVKRGLGERRALHSIWWLCRGLYATCIASGFQLPLERENVFRSSCDAASEVSSTLDSRGQPEAVSPPRSSRAWRT